MAVETLSRTISETQPTANGVAVIDRVVKTPKSNNVNRNPNFYTLRQDGVMRVKEDVNFGVGAISHNEWKNTSDTNRMKVRTTRDQIATLLGVENLRDIPPILADPVAKQQASDRAYELIGNMYGIEAKPCDETEKEKEQRLERLKDRVREYGETANNVIATLTNGKLSQFRTDLEMVNDVQDSHDPINLLAIALDNNYAKNVRFEAKRKLVLMNLAAAIDQRERDIQSDNKKAELNSFLNTWVYSPTLKVGATDNSYLYSQHNPETYETLDVKVIPQDEGKSLPLEPGEKKTLIKRRSFNANGREIPVYVHTRTKDSAAKVLKLLRKGQENPSLAVDDDLGLMAVLDTKSDVMTFLKHLKQSAVKAGSILQEEEVKNTLNGEKHKPSSAGSSVKTRMYQSHARVNGMRFELMAHTNETYLNYMTQDEVSHDEYEVTRLFDSGVMDLLFPEDIYHTDHEYMREAAIQKVRRDIRSY